MDSGSTVPLYRHTQVGYTVLVVLVLIAAVVAYRFATGDGGADRGRVGFAIILAVLAGCALAFASLTIQVNERSLSWAFGPGLFRQRLELAEISDLRVVQNQFWYGFGIRRFRGGWLYNVSGGTAVEIGTARGRRVRLGTDEPDQLIDAIRSAVRARGHADVPIR